MRTLGWPDNPSRPLLVVRHWCRAGQSRARQGKAVYDRGNGEELTYVLKMLLLAAFKGVRWRVSVVTVD